MDHLVYYVCLPCTYVKFCVCDSFTFGFDGRMWVLIVSGHCPPVFLRRMRIKVFGNIVLDGQL